MAQVLPKQTVRKGKTNTLPLLPQNAHVNSITFTNKFALVMLTPLHVCFTWVTVNIYLCKYRRPVILIFVYTNIYTGNLVVGYRTSGTTSWQRSPPTTCHSLGTEKTKLAKEIVDHGLWKQVGARTSTRLASVMLELENYTAGNSMIPLEEFIWDGDLPEFFAGMKCMRQINAVLGIVHSAVQTAKGESCLNSSRCPGFYWKWISSSKKETTAPFMISVLQTIIFVI